MSVVHQMGRGAIGCTCGAVLAGIPGTLTHDDQCVLFDWLYEHTGRKGHAVTVPWSDYTRTPYERWRPQDKTPKPRTRKKIAGGSSE